MQSIFSTSMTPSTKPTSSCVQCFERKVKCNRELPCSACVKHKVDCIYRPRNPPRKRRKVQDHEKPIPVPKGESSSAVIPLANATQNTSLGAGNESSPSDQICQLPTPSSINSGTEPHPVRKARLLQASGRSAFVDNVLWSRVVEELHGDHTEPIHDSSHESDEDTSDDEQLYALGFSPKASCTMQHPTGSVVLELWNVFKRNVDPLAKVIHVPTMSPVIERATQNLTQLPRGLEALLFAIYSITVLSMKDAECLQVLGESRDGALQRYVSTTRFALSRAKFMTTTSMVVLQALFIHILSIRDSHDARLIFTLTGVAIRIAEGMGVHRDGTSLGLPPFETEIRRRLWWQIKMHDWKTSELAGLTKFGAPDTHPNKPQPPANVNDDELYPGMKDFPVETGKATDMMFCVLRIEFANHVVMRAVRVLVGGSDFEDSWWQHTDEDNEKNLEDLKDYIESKYIRYCDPTVPLHLIALFVARSAFEMYHFSCNHPRGWATGKEVPEAKRKLVWQSCLGLIEKFNLAQSNPTLECFAWHMNFYVHWHPLVHILDTLRSTPLIPDAERAWQMIETLYKNNPQLITDIRRPVNIAVGSLTLKAHEARRVALLQVDNTNHPVAEFITQLQEQRERLKAERLARAQKQKRRWQRRTEIQPVNQMKSNPPATESTGPANATAAMEQAQFPNELLPDDGLWFAQGFDESLLGPDATNDLSLMFPSPDVVEKGVSRDLNWEQWEALISQTSTDLDLAWMHSHF